MPPHQSSDAKGPDPYHIALLAKQPAANSQLNKLDKANPEYKLIGMLTQSPPEEVTGMRRRD